MNEKWLPEPDARVARAARTWLAADKKNGTMSPDHLALWLKSAPDGKRLRAALAAYDAPAEEAPNRGG